MYFKDIIGQEEIKKRLIHSAQTGVVPHAQLFTEQGGAGAFPLALAYARYLNCTNRTETDSCGHCPSCLKYNELAHPDLHFVFPIVSKKEKKKEVCDDYLTEWRDFLKDRPYFDIDGWLDHIDAGNSQALIYSKESDRDYPETKPQDIRSDLSHPVGMASGKTPSDLCQQTPEDYRGTSPEHGDPDGIGTSRPGFRNDPVPCTTYQRAGNSSGRYRFFHDFPVQLDSRRCQACRPSGKRQLSESSRGNQPGRGEQVLLGTVQRHDAQFLGA